MSLTDENDVLTSLLRTNQQLVEVQRQIASSLMNLERLYAEQLQRNEALSRSTRKMMKQFQSPTLTAWFLYLPIIVIFILTMVPIVVNLFKN